MSSRRSAVPVRSSRWLGVLLVFVVSGVINFRELLSYRVALYEEWLFPFSVEYVPVEDTAEEVEVFPSGLHGFKIGGFHFGRDNAQAMFFLWVDDEGLSGIHDGRFSEASNSRFFFVDTALAVDSRYPSWGTAKIKKRTRSTDLISLPRSAYIPFPDGQIGALRGLQGEIGGFSAFGSSICALLGGFYCKPISFGSFFSKVGLPPYLLPLAESEDSVNDCGNGGDARYVNCRPRSGWWPHPILFGLYTYIIGMVSGLGGCTLLDFYSYGWRCDRYGYKWWLRRSAGVLLLVSVPIWIFFSASVGIMGYWWVR